MKKGPLGKGALGRGKVGEASLRETRRDGAGDQAPRPAVAKPAIRTIIASVRKVGAMRRA